MNERPANSPAFAMVREIEAAKVLREQLRAVTDDEETIRDTVEGETSLREMIRDMLANIGEREAQISGLETYIGDLSSRKDRFKRQIEHSRALICSAMDMAGIQKHEMDIGTIALSKVRPSLIVTNEAEIPTDFWKASDPKLDRSALKKALDAGDTIPGATLSNGGQTITIRRK